MTVCMWYLNSDILQAVHILNSRDQDDKGGVDVTAATGRRFIRTWMVFSDVLLSLKQSDWSNPVHARPKVHRLEFHFRFFAFSKYVD